MTFDPSFPMAILESLVREGRADSAEGGDVLGRALVGLRPEGDGHHGEVIAGDAVGEEVGLDGVAVFCIVDAVGIGEEDAGRVVVAAFDEVDAVPAFLERVQPFFIVFLFSVPLYFCSTNPRRLQHFFLLS